MIESVAICCFLTDYMVSLLYWGLVDSFMLVR